MACWPGRLGCRCGKEFRRGLFGCAGGSGGIGESGEIFVFTCI